jgi:hypothetical protein
MYGYSARAIIYGFKKGMILRWQRALIGRMDRRRSDVFDAAGIALQSSVGGKHRRRYVATRADGRPAVPAEAAKWAKGQLGRLAETGSSNNI